MRHGSAYDDIVVEVAILEPFDDLGHEAGNFVRSGCPVDEVTIPSRDADRAGPPQARALVSLEVASVEVKIENDPVEPSEDWITGHDADVVHSSGVAGHGHAIFVLRV